MSFDSLLESSISKPTSSPDSVFIVHGANSATPTRIVPLSSISSSTSALAEPVKKAKSNGLSSLSVFDLAMFGFSVISGVAALDYVSIVTDTSAFVQILLRPMFLSDSSCCTLLRNVQPIIRVPLTKHLKLFVLFLILSLAGVLHAQSIDTWIDSVCADCTTRMESQTGVYILEMGEEALIGRAWL